MNKINDDIGRVCVLCTFMNHCLKCVLEYSYSLKSARLKYCRIYVITKARMLMAKILLKYAFKNVKIYNSMP